MNKLEAMFTLFSIVSFCLGWRIITDKGNLLYFIKKPFENLDEYIEAKQSIYKLIGVKNTYYLAYLRLLKLKRFIAQPFIICITCFASIWGSLVFITLNGIDIKLIPYLILTCVSASFIQTFIWHLYERYIQ